MKSLLAGALAQSYTYPEYRSFFAELVKQGKTTGYNQSEYYLEITRLNQSRMDRLDKKSRFTPATEAGLVRLANHYQLLVLTEAWCGDAAQSIPLLNHMAEATDNLDLRLVLRDEHPELMDHFLTDRGRSIPKVIILDADTQEVLGSWGPGPHQRRKWPWTIKIKPSPKKIIPPSVLHYTSGTQRIKRKLPRKN